MSIKIDADKCTGCGKCLDICPGSLLYRNKNGKSYIRYPKDCWGCTSCLKECQAGAIKYYLGADIGGKGATLHTKKEKHFLQWHVEKADGEVEIIIVDQKESNKY